MSSRPNTLSYLAIGKIVRPWGVQGEVKVEVLTDWPERFGLLEYVYLGEQAKLYRLERFRLYKGYALLKLADCDDRVTAEALRGQLVQIPSEKAMPLDEGEYYVHQIEGLEVWTDEGESLGHVVEVLFTGSNEVYVVHGPQGEVLIPAIADVVLQVDLEEGRLIVHLMDGLLGTSQDFTGNKPSHAKTQSTPR
ncbi:MAG: ribosome maturation factor RimM, partial [Anaerolineae bacterium]|nr:ribosome maturation factor RimM [Anaerolineae bacterium]